MLISVEAPTDIDGLIVVEVISQIIFTVTKFDKSC